MNRKRTMEQSQAQMERAFEQFNGLMEKLRLAMEALREAILKMVHIIIKEIKRICEAFRRWLLYVKLIHWHFPHRIAKFMAGQWPNRWLPDLTNFLECGTILLR